MKRKMLKFFAALACAGMVVSAYATCYTYGYAVIVPEGTTTTAYTYMACTLSSDTYSFSGSWQFSIPGDVGVGNYRFNPPTPGHYYASATASIVPVFQSIDCNNSVINYANPTYYYPIVTGAANCSYP